MVAVPGGPPPGASVEVERLTDLLEASRRDADDLRAKLHEVRHSWRRQSTLALDKPAQREQSGRPSGEAPTSWCRDASAYQLTERRSQHSALAHNPVDDHGVPGNRRTLQNSCWTSHGRASRAVTRRHRGCISNPVTADRKRVHQ